MCPQTKVGLWYNLTAARKKFVTMIIKTVAKLLPADLVGCKAAHSSREMKVVEPADLALQTL